jgi:hypothetical protein
MTSAALIRLAAAIGAVVLLAAVGIAIALDEITGSQR